MNNELTLNDVFEATCNHEYIASERRAMARESAVLAARHAAWVKDNGSEDPFAAFEPEEIMDIDPNADW